MYTVQLLYPFVMGTVCSRQMHSNPPPPPGFDLEATGVVVRLQGTHAYFSCFGCVCARTMEYAHLVACYCILGNNCRH